MKNLILGYIHATEAKKAEVLQVIAKILNFSELELKKASGMQSKGWLGGLWRGNPTSTEVSIHTTTLDYTSIPFPIQCSTLLDFGHIPIPKVWEYARCSHFVSMRPSVSVHFFLFFFLPVTCCRIQNQYLRRSFTSWRLSPVRNMPLFKQQQQVLQLLSLPATILIH